MNRSTGVTVSVVIAILGSLLSLVFGGLLILTVATATADQPLPDLQPAPPVSVPVILLFEGIGAIGIGMIGLAFAIGLFKLHNWARIGFIVFASILCFFAVTTALLSALIGFAAGPFMPQNQEIPPGLIAFTVAAMIGMAVILGVLGTSWLIFFTRSSVKAQFKGEGVTTPQRGPLIPKVIAWLLIVGGINTLLLILLGFPVILFGHVLRNALAKIVLALFAFAGLIDGVGILRWRSWGYSLAIGFYSLGVLNQLSLIVAPGAMANAQAEMLALMSGGMPARVPVAFFWVGFIMGSIATVVPLWLLIRGRKSFLEASGLPVLP